jgi:zinc protease
MKKTALFFVLSCLLVFTVSAQVDRSQRPLPGPAPVIQLGEFESFTMDNGMRVIVVENRQVPVVSFQLTLDIDPVMEGDAKGYVGLAGNMLREGTTNRSKNEIDESIDFIGASLSTFSTGMFASSLTRHTETLLDLMADILMNPSFPEAELERLRTQSISALATQQNDANAMAQNVATAVAYGPDHPYGEVATRETYENVTIDMIREYYNKHFKPNVAYMVVVGDINVDEARNLMTRFFSQWQPGEVPTRTWPTPEPPQGRRVAFADRMGAIQSVVTVTYPIVLTPGHEDAIKASVMNSVLGGGVFSGRLMQNLREDKGYTYGARSSLGNDRLVSRFTARTEVRNSVTDSTVVEILNEMYRLIHEPVEAADLELTKNAMSGNFARALENPRTIANFALNIERHNLPEDYYATYLEKLDAVTADDVQAMAAKYLKPDNSWIVVAGNKDEVADNLKVFSATGEVKLFDAFGRPVQEDAIRPAPTGVTVETVLNNYFEAVGGRSNLENIRDITQKMSASMMGQTINITYFQKAPNKLLVETAMGGMVLSKQLFDGEKAIITSPMGRQEFTEGPEFEMMKQQAVIDAELRYKELGIEKNLQGIEKINGKDAYKVEVIARDGTRSYDYYDVESGFKIQTVSPQGTATYSDYRQVGNLWFPYALSQQMGPQSIDMTVTEIKVNSGLEDDIFRIE